MQEKLLQAHISKLKKCQQCPGMTGPVVTHAPVASKVYIMGQAPGPREGALGKPFAWTAGSTLFKWFQAIGLDETAVRAKAYIGAACRCFPGKTSSGGDRVPSASEIAACSSWMKREFEIMQPSLVIPVGKVAIDLFLENDTTGGASHIVRSGPLIDVIGKQFKARMFGCDCDVIPLPHPSGVSTWFKRDPGKTLTEQALRLIDAHPQWQSLKNSDKLFL